MKGFGSARGEEGDVACFSFLTPSLDNERNWTKQKVTEANEGGGVEFSIKWLWNFVFPLLNSCQQFVLLLSVPSKSRWLSFFPAHFFIAIWVDAFAHFMPIHYPLLMAMIRSASAAIFLSSRLSFNKALLWTTNNRPSNKISLHEDEGGTGLFGGGTFCAELLNFLE